MAQLKVGQFYIATVTSSVPADPVPAGTVVASSDNPAVTVGPADPANNTLKVSGVSAGTANVTYSAPGFLPVTEKVDVAAMPQLVVTDGPPQT